MERPLTELLSNNVPRAYLARLLQGMMSLYPQSHDECFRRREFPWAVNLLPFERRADVQQLMLDVAEFFPGEVSGVATQGETQTNWWYYSRVISGSVILTSSSAPNPEHVIRFSEARHQYSRHTHRQRSFLDEDTDEIVTAGPEDCNLYGILLHGHGGAYKDLGFAVIRFPTPDLKGYYSERIDLFKEFPDIAGGDNRKPQLGGGPGGDDIEFHDQDEKA
jgi:hypothetical protein